MAENDRVDSDADTGENPVRATVAAHAERTQVGRPATPQPVSGLEETVLPANPAAIALTVHASERAGDLATLPEVNAELYTVGAEINRGGMGRILAARDRKLRRDVVIKVLRGGGAASSRFEREALITARLQHPSIVRVYDAGILDGESFYAMEHVRGESLDRVVAKADDAQARLALLPHVIAIADALAYAHNEGVIHRDLKPANVLVGSFGETVVIDWGLAKDLRRSDGPESLDPAKPILGGGKTVGALGALASEAASHDLTLAGAVMGTPAYMPPEQARGEPADERSDVYAIGAILYAVLSGTPPITGERALDDARAGGIPSLRERAAEAPPELISIVEHAMAYSPNDRYATAGDLADELRRFAQGKLVARHSYSTGALIRRWIRRHRGAVAVALTALIVLGGLSIVGVRRLADERDRADLEAETARDALTKLEQESDDMIVHQATAVLASDPSQVIAWLRRLSPHGLERPIARELADDAAKRGIAFELAGPKDDIEHVVVADGNNAYTGSDDGHVWRWQLAAFRGADLGAHTGPIEVLTVSADGFWLATGGTDHEVRVWNLFKGENRVLAGHTASVRGVTFSPDGNMLASTSQDGTLWLWDVTTGTGHVTIHDAHPLRPVVWSLDGKRVWTGTGDGRVLEIEVATGKLVPIALKPHPEEVRTLALSPDGTQLASGGKDGAAYVWSLADHKPRKVSMHVDGVRDIVWSIDGRRVVTAGNDKLVHVFDLATGTSIELEGNTSGVKDLAISRDGAWIAAAGLDGKARMWPITGGKARTFAGHSAGVKSVAFTPDGGMLLSASEDDRLRLWPLAAPPPAPTGAALAKWLAARSNLVVASP